ncbi:hypothetical protein E4U11_007240 [Claviceps purpurea]|nr:hypothetical protein E4U11_007240 [Claviceps purpurea]
MVCYFVDWDTRAATYLDLYKPTTRSSATLPTKTKPIPKRNQRIREFLQGDVPAAVHVEAVKEGAPRGEEGPEAAEFVKVDGAVAV